VNIHTSNYRALNVSIGKLLITAAWVDGELNNYELESLKSLILQLPEVNFEDWRKLKIYLAYPLTPTEQANVVSEFIDKVYLKGHSQLAWNLLLKVFQSDGLVNLDEKDFAKSLDQELNESTNGILKKLRFFFCKTTIERQPAWGKKNSGREKFIHEFFDNPVYFIFRKALLSEDLSVSKTKPELQKICLMASILSWFARLDGKLSIEETDFIKSTLTQKCELSSKVASCIMRITSSVNVSDIQLKNLCSSFFEHSLESDRNHIFSSISKLVIFDGVLSLSEMEGLRTLALYLDISKKLWCSCIEKIHNTTLVYEE